MIRFCLVCHNEFAGERTTACPRCQGYDTMGVSCTAREANERWAALRSTAMSASPRGTDIGAGRRSQSRQEMEEPK